MSPPEPIGMVVDPEQGHVLAIEGVVGRLSLGRRLFDGPVDGVWSAGPRALVRAAAGWQLLEWSESWSVVKGIDLGARDWSAPVWNGRGSAWFVCGEGTGICGIYRGEDGRLVRELRGGVGLRPVGLSDNGVDALVSEDGRAFLWTDSDALVPVAAGEGLLGAFAPGGERLVTLDAAGALTFFDVRTAASRQMEAPAGGVGVAWSGGSLVSVHRSGEIRRWDERAELVFAGSCGCEPVGAWAAGQGLIRLHDSLKQVGHFIDFRGGEAVVTLLPALAPEVR
ncbi:MAG: hypothetical protein ACK58M_10610 [Acidobacteriota bacterium]|nr:hypothetical protein [Bryobacteraceae bacterium CoA2 C42]MCA2964875.1 hypothetical protein [Acidobacteriaceae bacterium]